MRSSQAVRSSVTTSPGWQWMMPNFAVGIFILAMVALVWTLRTREFDQQMATLARDVQWAEQTIRLHMQSDQEFLQEQARGASDGQMSSAEFHARANLYLASNPHLSGIAWINGDQIVRDAASGGADYWVVGEGFTSDEDTEGFVATRNSGHPAYGKAHISEHSGPTLELFVPIKRGHEFLGAMVAAYPVSGMLRHLVPAGFSEKYHLSFTGVGNQMLGENSAARPRDESLSYSLDFDPPGNGMQMHVVAYRTDTTLAKTLPILSPGCRCWWSGACCHCATTWRGASAPRTRCAPNPIFARRWRNPCPPACAPSTCAAASLTSTRRSAKWSAIRTQN